MTRETSIALRARVPVVAGLLFLVGNVALSRRTESPPPREPVVTCAIPSERIEPVIEAPATVMPVVAPVAKPTPGPDVYAKLATCLQNTKPLWGQQLKVTVAEIRHWVEVEHDPVWREGDAWWLPLSGEGESGHPSGLYISVPLHGSTCGGAIIN